MEKPTKSRKIIGVRHFQFFIWFIVMFIFFGMRISMSVAIISMTEEVPPDPSIPTYPEWDNSDIILSALSWGDTLPQLIAGQLSERFGPKWFLTATMVIGSLLNMAIPPMAAALGSTGVIICRVFQGLCQAFTYPCMHNLISKWTPLYERSLIAHFVYGGATLGIVGSMPMTGAIAGSKMGWPVAFYVYGGLGLATAAIFAIWGANSPSTYKGISEEERNYIEASTSITSEKKLPTPWKSIFTSVPIYAILICGISQNWGGITLLTEIPTYMNRIMNFDINSNSQLSALPYLTQFFIGLIISPLADFIASRKIVTVTTSRKIFNAIGSYLPAAALIYLAFLENRESDIVVTLLVIAVTAATFSQSGYFINLIDIAPNHSATLLGLVNGASNVVALLAPMTVGFFGTDKTNPILWRKVFLLSAGLYAVGGTLYLFFATAEVQPWNESGGEKSDAESVITEKQTNSDESVKVINIDNTVY